MAFKAGSIYGEAILDTKKWNQGLKSIVSGVGKSLAIASGLFIAGMTKSIMAANEFQKSMSNVSTLIDETVISTQDLTKNLLRLDPALGKTTELTDALYQSFSSGAKTAEEAMQTTVDAAKFAKAGVTDTSTAVDVLTSTVNAYGKEIVSTTQASDIFFTAIKEGKLTGESLAGAIGQSIPLFASAKVDVKELAAGMAAMTKQGIQVNESTTQLNAIINSMLKPTGKLITLILEQGYASGSALLEAEGLAGTLKILEEATGGDATAIAQLIPNLRGMKGAMALTGKGGEEFTNILEKMENATGVTGEAFQKQEKTFETLVSSLDKVQIVIGNVGKHFVDKIAVGATNAAQGVLQFLMSSRGMEVVGDIVATTAGTFNALKTGIQPIVDTIGPAIEEIMLAITESGNKLSGSTTEGAGAFKILAIASKGLSIGITIVSKVISGAIENITNLVDAISKSAGVVGGFFEALVGGITWDEFGERVDSAGNAFVEFGTGVVENTVDLVDTVVKEFSNFGEATDMLAEDMKASFETTFTVTKQYVNDSWDEMITGQEDFTNSLANGFSEINNILEEENDEIIDETEDTTEKLEITWKDYFDKISSMASEFTSGLFDIFDQYYTNQQAQLDLDTQAQLDALDEQYENGLITEEEYIAKKEEIENDAREKENEIAKKQFMANKVNRIADIWINAGSSIAGWWAAAPSLGPVAGPIFAGIMTAATLTMAGIQTALVAQQKFVPSMATGGLASGLTRINEVGGEIVNLPDNSLVIPHDISSQIADNVSDKNTIINVSFKGANINDNISLNKIVDKVAKKLGKELRLAG